jgi:molybdopterin synthase sulfur carrier subunit
MTSFVRCAAWERSVVEGSAIPAAADGSTRAGTRASTVTVRYFAAAAEAAGVESEELPMVATVGQLRMVLVERYGDPMVRVLAAGSFLVDGVVSRNDDRTLGERVDVLPPFAGG